MIKRVLGNAGLILDDGPRQTHLGTTGHRPLAPNWF